MLCLLDFIWVEGIESGKVISHILISGNIVEVHQKCILGTFMHVGDGELNAILLHILSFTLFGAVGFPL